MSLQAKGIEQQDMATRGLFGKTHTPTGSPYSPLLVSLVKPALWAMNLLDVLEAGGSEPWERHSKSPMRCVLLLVPSGHTATARLSNQHHNRSQVRAIHLCFANKLCSKLVQASPGSSGLETARHKSLMNTTHSFLAQPLVPVFLETGAELHSPVSGCTILAEQWAGLWSHVLAMFQMRAWSAVTSAWAPGVQGTSWPQGRAQFCPIGSLRPG